VTGGVGGALSQGTAGSSAGVPAAGSGPVASAGSSGAAAGSGGVSETAGGAAPSTPQLAVSADFLNQTLSIVSVDKLVAGATRDDALVGTVDLSKYAPGPLAIAVTPDGKTALVSISGGWLRLVASNVPAGDGTLLFVDLASRTVTGELNTGASPMGIVIAHDGKHAFVGQLSDTYMAYVDIEKKTFERIATGNSWNEEFALDDTGTVGALTTGTAGNALTFSVAAPKTNGITRNLTGDAGGVAFFPGTKFAFVVQAPTDLTGNTGGYNVIDASDPAAPKVTDSNRVPGDTRKAYPVTSVPSRKSVVYPFADGKLSLVEMSLEAGKAKVVQTIPVADATFAYGLAASAEGIVLTAVSAEHYVAVVDLNTGKAFTVPWNVTKSGPVDVKFIPKE
jgi:hypothetical protein